MTALLAKYLVCHPGLDKGNRQGVSAERCLYELFRGSSRSCDIPCLQRAFLAQITELADPLRLSVGTAGEHPADPSIWGRR